MAFELTSASLRRMCKERNQYSSRPDLNEILHLHYKGITKLENLDEYTGLRTLYLECNAIEEIEGLEKLVEMRCLYLGQNILRSVAGLHTMTHLETLDVSENDISHVDNLSCLPKLRTLNIAANKLASAASIAHLTECPSLTSVDLGKNQLEEEGAVALLQALSGLSLLRLQGNPVVSRVKHYRKAMVAAMPGLKYLDDSPVFDKERRLAVAFSQGGFEGERAEREAIRSEEAATRERHRKAFDDMVAEAKAKPPVPRDPMRFRAVPPGESDSEDDSDLPPSCRISRRSRGLKMLPQPIPEPLAPQDSLSGGEVEALPPLQTGVAMGVAAGEVAVGVNIEDPGEEAVATAELETAAVGDGAEGGAGTAVAAEEGCEAPHRRSLHSTPSSTSEDFVMVQACKVAEEADAQTEAVSLLAGDAVSSMWDLKAELAEKAAARQRRREAAGDVAVAGNAAYEKARRGPSVWGTDRYKRLWAMACEVGQQQEAAEETEATDGEQAEATDSVAWVQVGEDTAGLSSHPSTSASTSSRSAFTSGSSDGADGAESSDGEDDEAEDSDEELFERYAVRSIAGSGPPPPAAVERGRGGGEGSRRDGMGDGVMEEGGVVALCASSVSIAIDDSLYELD